MSAASAARWSEAEYSAGTARLLAGVITASRGSSECVPFSCGFQTAAPPPSRTETTPSGESSRTSALAGAVANSSAEKTSEAPAQRLLRRTRVRSVLFGNFPTTVAAYSTADSMCTIARRG